MNPKIASRFTSETRSEPLSGGQGNSVRFGNIVVKPVDEIEKYRWIAEVLQGVEVPDAHISRPIKSRAGNWTEDGFGATTFHDGLFEKGRMPEKLEAAERFHAATKSILKPAEFDLWSSPWSRAAAVAWAELEPPTMIPSYTQGILDKIFGEYQELDLPSQLIHSDLAGNILFDGRKPIVIDVSPAFRPPEYAAVMLVTDSIAWHDEPTKSIDLVNIQGNLKRQLILRTVAFRLAVPLFFDPMNQNAFDSNLRPFRKILDHIEVRI